MKFKKADLQYRDYSWKAVSGDDPNIRGTSDREKLNRREGYEVLYFINKFMEDRNFGSLEDFHAIETKIHEKLPGEIQKREEVEKWLAIEFLIA